jgi:hypothetical protein
MGLARCDLKARFSLLKIEKMQAGIALLAVLILLAIASFIAIDNFKLAKKISLLVSYNYDATALRQLSRSSISSLLTKARAQVGKGTLTQFTHSLAAGVSPSSYTLVRYCINQRETLSFPCAPQSLYAHTDITLTLDIMLTRVQDLQAQFALVSTATSSDNKFIYYADIQIIWEDTQITKIAKVKLLRWYKGN